MNGNNKENYFSLVRKLDEVFPSTVDCDYTKIPPMELFNKFEEVFGNTDFYSRLDIAGRNSIRNVILTEQDSLYLRTSYIGLKNEIIEGFDQNHYLIKTKVITMRNHIMRMMHLKYFGERGKLDRMYDDRYDDVKDIELLIEPKAIEEHVRKKLVITKENRDGRYDNLSYIIANEICLYYGFGINSEIRNRVGKRIEEAFESAKIKYSYGDPSYRERTNFYEGLSGKLDLAVSDVVEIVHMAASNLLYNKNAFISKRAQALLDDLASDKGVSDNLNINEKKVAVEEKRFDEKNKHHEESDDYMVSSNKKDYDLSEEYDALLARFERMKKLIERNKQIMSEIAELNSTIEALQAELDKNNEELGVSKRGSLK